MDPDDTMPCPAPDTEPCPCPVLEDPEHEPFAIVRPVTFFRHPPPLDADEMLAARDNGSDDSFYLLDEPVVFVSAEPASPEEIARCVARFTPEEIARGFDTFASEDLDE